MALIVMALIVVVIAIATFILARAIYRGKIPTQYVPLSIYIGGVLDGIAVVMLGAMLYTWLFPGAC